GMVAAPAMSAPIANTRNDAARNDVPSETSGEAFGETFGEARGAVTSDGKRARRMKAGERRERADVLCFMNLSEKASLGWRGRALPLR
ncbi:hypothetical protein SB724_20570, partial [Bacillus sp. SIMBA_031]|uniref:hypothetical protein n=1 Tax=Bacillus sp. SIMBA_031 TaxID=3085774 RepID=UPI0039794E46